MQVSPGSGKSGDRYAETATASAVHAPEYIRTSAVEPIGRILRETIFGSGWIRGGNAHLDLSSKLPPPLIATSYSKRDATLPTWPATAFWANLSFRTSLCVWAPRTPFCSEIELISSTSLPTLAAGSDRWPRRSLPTKWKRAAKPKSHTVMPHSDFAIFKSNPKLSFKAVNASSEPSTVGSVATIPKSSRYPKRGILSQLAASVAIARDTVL